MRKYGIPLLSLYLDFIVVDTVLGLVALFLGVAIEAMSGIPVTWAVRVVASLVVLTVLRLLNLSIGEWLIGPAVAEREAGVVLRQWPNLLLGAWILLTGLKEMVRWTAPGEQVPFLFMVEETPFKILALCIHGALYVLGGVMVLRFAPGARLFNAVLLVFGAAMMTINLVFYREAMIEAQIVRRLNQGLPADPGAAEAVISWAPVAGGAMIVLMAVLLWLSRERPARRGG